MDSFAGAWRQSSRLAARRDVQSRSVDWRALSNRRMGAAADYGFRLPGGGLVVQNFLQDRRVHRLSGGDGGRRTHRPWSPVRVRARRDGVALSRVYGGAAHALLLEAVARRDGRGFLRDRLRQVLSAACDAGAQGLANAPGLRTRWYRHQSITPLRSAANVGPRYGRCAGLRIFTVGRRELRRGRRWGAASDRVDPSADKHLGR